jgi:mannobiose 2-epimerase
MNDAAATPPRLTATPVRHRRASSSAPPSVAPPAHLPADEQLQRRSEGGTLVRLHGILCHIESGAAGRHSPTARDAAAANLLRRAWRSELEAELLGNILPFYAQVAVDRERGGFYGLIHNDLRVEPDAPRGVIQVTRILWAFAHATRVLDMPALLATADRAWETLRSHFIDHATGGLHWSVAADGTPLDRRRLIYAQAFGIYAFAEYALATGSHTALYEALALFDLIERNAWDHAGGGYVEGCTHDWQPDPGQRVDEVTGPVAFSMNTHLHLVEAYTTLLHAVRVAGERTEAVEEALARSLDVMLQKVVLTSGHFGLQFDASWQPLDDRISYGHDIEGSWLLVEAADAVGDADTVAAAHAVALRLARLTLTKGVDADGGLFNEGDPTGPTDTDKDWWPQAEAMVGFLNAFQLSGDEQFLHAARASWQFIQTHIVDRTHGEWFWGVSRDGKPLDHQKTGPWKGPYHNGRACLETIRRLDGIR